MGSVHRDSLIANEVKKMINKEFPLLEIFIICDKEEDCFYVTIFDEKTYHTTEYQQLIMKIKVEYLWANDINNYLFVYESDMQNVYEDMDYRGSFIIDVETIHEKKVNVTNDMTIKNYSTNLDYDQIFVHGNIAA